MDTFFIEPNEFWEIFNHPDVDKNIPPSKPRSVRPSLDRNIQNTDFEESSSLNQQQCYGKRMKTTDNKPRLIAETDAAIQCDSRYVIMWGPHKPGKKTKVWEGDGYLSLVGQMAHLSDLRGRLLEDPTILDDVDFKCVEDLGELQIGNTEVQVIELDNDKPK